MTSAKYYWARRDSRWDVYPGEEPLQLVRVEKVGAFSRIFLANGHEVRMGMILVREAEGQ